MTTEIKFNSSLNGAIAAQGTTTNDQASVQTEKTVLPLLGGENVKVSSGAMSDLEKLVARLKSENENTRANLAQMRFTAVMTALDAANVRLTQEQTAAFQTLTDQQAVKDSLESQLASICESYGISGDDSASVVMEAKIKSLEQAVERAVQEGKDHNETVKKTKEQLARDQAKLDRLENAEEKDEAAITAAKEAVADAQGAYDAATAVAAGDAKAISDAQAALAKAKSDVKEISTLQTSIAKATENIDASIAVLGNDKMQEIAKALNKIAEDVEPSENRDKDAGEEEKKAIVLDPANVICAALDKIDEMFLRTIDENQMLKA